MVSAIYKLASRDVESFVFADGLDRYDAVQAVPPTALRDGWGRAPGRWLYPDDDPQRPREQRSDMPAFGWSVTIPVIREECHDIIDAVSEADVERLSVETEGESLIMIHPLTIVSGALDLETSELQQIPGLIFGVRRYQFHRSKLPASGIFRLEEVPTAVLLTDNIVTEIMRANPLNVAFDLVWSADEAAD